MSLSPLNYPSDFDSAAYFSFLAEANNQDSIAEGLQKTWLSLPAPLYLSMQLIWMKLTGFSYIHALIFQGGVIVGLCIGILGLIYRYHKNYFGIEPRSFRLIFTIMALGLIAISRFLYVSPANIFDFRLDIIPSLLLTIALLTLEQRNGLTALSVAIAICERYHNLSILLATVIIWAAIASGSHAKPISFRSFLSRFWSNICYPCLGLLIVLVLRGQQLYQLFWYYTQHFGLDKELRGFGGWGSPGYFSFYPDSFFHQYLNYTAYPFLGVTAIALFIALRQGKGRALRASLIPFLPLVLGGAIAFVLLVIDPSRNNTGVLRYAWVPIVFAWVGLVSALMLMLDWTQFRSTHLGQSFATAGLLVLSLWGTSLEVNNFHQFYQSFDHRGIRQFDIVHQLEPIFKKLYREAEAQPNQAGIRVGATFSNEYNFHQGQWEIFLATHKLKHLPYNFLIGTAFYSPDFRKLQLPLLQQVDYVASGSRGCLNREVPLNQDFRENLSDVRAIVKQRCSTKIGKVQLQGCRIQVLKCSSGLSTGTILPTTNSP